MEGAALPGEFGASPRNGHHRVLDDHRFDSRCSLITDDVTGIKKTKRREFC